jgi:hypothetical protein
VDGVRQKRRPRGITFEVYDPWDGQMLVRVESMAPWDANRAAHGRYSRHIQKTARLLKRIGRPDGKPLGLRNLGTRTTLIW